MPTFTHPSTSVVGNTVSEPPVYTPITAATIALAPSALLAYAVVAPVATIAALTLTLASGNVAGQRQTIVFTQVITTLTCSGANLSATVLPLPVTTTANQRVEFIWSQANLYWIRVA